MRNDKGQFTKGEKPDNYKGENDIVYQDENKTIFVCESRKHGMKKVTVDTEDWGRIKKYRWYPHLEQGGAFYIYANNDARNGIIKLHRFVVGCAGGLDVDHKNRDTLDNRKSNLRMCTRSQNNMNRVKTDKNTSGYKGVVWLKGAGKWKAQIKKDGHVIYLGLYECAKRAACAYNDAALKYHGEFARINEGI